MNYLIFSSIIFTTLGIFFSPSVLGIGDILLLIPLVFSIFWARRNKVKLPLPNIFLLVTFAIAVIIAFIVIDDKIVALKSIKKARYFLIGGLSYLPFMYFFKEGKGLLEKARKYYLPFVLVCFTLSIGYGIYQAIIQHGFVISKLLSIRLAAAVDITKFAYISSFLTSLLTSLLLLGNLDKRNRFCGILVACLGVFGVLAAKTRGALLSLLISLSSTIYFKSKKLALVLFCSFFVLIGIMFALQGSKYEKSFRMVTLMNKSTQHRIALYEAGLAVFKERPLTGFGYGQSINEIGRVAKENKIENLFYVLRTHHTFLDIAADIGVFGLLAFSGWFFSWAFITLTSTSVFTKSTLALVVNAFICAQFDVFNQTNLFAFILLVFNLSIVTHNLEKEKASKNA
ncbi:O-antigen ligase family protein [Halobacteriovorax sp. RT-1-4]|uniref:O-antigen ligase family protein n=1 Tax=unclassified Halobacteriovorax TaxID=2639665 RepID=UPI0039995D6D